MCIFYNYNYYSVFYYILKFKEIKEYVYCSFVNILLSIFLSH